MKGKQSSDILFKDYDHMDAFCQLPGIHPETEGGSHYMGAGTPTFFSSIAVCFDDVDYPWDGDSEGRVNCTNNVWEKIYDDSWLTKGCHYFFGWMEYRRYAEQEWYHPFFAFVDYKNFFVQYHFLNLNTVNHYCNGNKVAILKRYSYSYGTPTGMDKKFIDTIDGHVYDFSNNPWRGAWLSQNGFDWYPCTIKIDKKYKGWYESDFVYAVQNGFYSGTRNPGGLIFTPYECSDEDSSIKFGKSRYLPIEESGGLSGNWTFDVGTDDIFSIYTAYDANWSGFIELQRVTPNGNSKRTRVLENAGHYIDISRPIGIDKKNKKAYFYSTRGIGTNWGRRNYYSPDYENIQYRIISVDQNGNVKVERTENGTVVLQENGYLSIKKSRLGSIFGNKNRTLYDEKTKYFYIYSRIPYDDPNFPKTSPDSNNYSRIMITKTKDFKSFETSAAPPYRILQGLLKKNSAAFCFDTQYEASLKAQYIMPNYDLLDGMYSYYPDWQNNGSQTDAWCFNSGKLCQPYGIFCQGRLYDYNKSNVFYRGFTWFFKDYMLRETEDDYLYSLRQYKSDGSIAWDDESQTILNQMYGLDYPGRDVE